MLHTFCLLMSWLRERPNESYNESRVSPVSDGVDPQLLLLHQTHRALTDLPASKL